MGQLVSYFLECLYLCELLLHRDNGVSNLQKQDKLSPFPVTLWGQDHLFKAFLLALNEGRALECDLLPSF